MQSLPSLDSSRRSSTAAGGGAPSFGLVNKKKLLPSVALTQAMTHVKDFMTDSQKALVLLREGRTLMDNGDVKGALDCFNQGISFNPGVSLFNMRAVCHKQLDMYKEAYFDYSFSIRLEPEIGTHYCNRGLVLSKLKKAMMAFEDLDLSIKYDPSSGHYYSRGTVYAEFGRNEEAITDYTQALSKEEVTSLNHEFFIKCRYRRALSYFELKMYEEVLQDCQAVLQFDAGSVNARSLMGRTYKIMNEHQKAEHQLTEAILFDDHQAALYTERGDIRFRTEQKNKIIEAIYDFDKAVTLLEAKLSARIVESATFTNVSASAKMSKFVLGANNNKPTTPSHHPFTKANSFGENQRGDMSSTSSSTHSNKPCLYTRPTFRFFNNLSKEDQVVSTSALYYKDIEDQLADTLYKRAQAKLITDPNIVNISSALEDAIRAMSLVDEDDDYHIVAATCYIRLNDFQSAASILENVLRRSPHNHKALYNLSFCKRAHGSQRDAIEGLSKIIEMKNAYDNMSSPEKHKESSTNSLASIPVHRVYEMRGTLFYEINAHKLALMDLGKAIAINPANPGNYFLRGDCHCKLGNYEQALSDYNLAEQTGFADQCALLLSRGSVRRLLRDVKKSLEDFQAAAAITNDKDKTSRARILSFCAFCHIDLQSYEEALLILTEASELNKAMVEEQMLVYNAPTSPSQDTEELVNKEEIKAQLLYLRRMEWILKYHVALCHYMLRDYSVAASYLLECLSEDLFSFIPDDLAKGAVYFYLGQCMQFLEMYEEAKERFESSMQTHFVDDTHHCFLVRFAEAKVLQTLGEQEKALELFHFCLSLQPDSAHCLFRRAWTYKALGDYQAAGADFENAKALQPNDPNFAIDYKRIAKCDYMIIHSDPDLVEPFPSLLPLPGLQSQYQ